MKITTVSALRFVTSIYPPVSLIRTLGYRKATPPTCCQKQEDKSCLKEGKKNLASGAQCGGFHRDVLNEKTSEKQQEKLRTEKKRMKIYFIIGCLIIVFYLINHLSW
ncbi:hypothetical protein CDAR_15511 [Caerostris darwini]|nr:hypothetical protein CDAR_15511 [Caerostris darwini]